jgi:hypothetical protein
MTEPSDIDISQYLDSDGCLTVKEAIRLLSTLPPEALLYYEKTPGYNAAYKMYLLWLTGNTYRDQEFHVQPTEGAKCVLVVA